MSIRRLAVQIKPITPPSVVVIGSIVVITPDRKVTPCSTSGKSTLARWRLRKSRQTRSDLLSTNHNLTTFAGVESLIVTVLGRVSPSGPGTATVRSAGGGGNDADTRAGKLSACVKPLTGGSNVVTCRRGGACQPRIISGSTGKCQGDCNRCARSTVSKSKQTSRSGRSCGTQG